MTENIRKIRDSSMRICRSSLLFALLLGLVSSFEWSSSPKLPEVDRHALAGIWRLTPRTSPMKEFTVYPKRQTPKEPDVLLMLKEDGSFQQYENSYTADDVDDSWSRFQEQRKAKKEREASALQRAESLKGTWDFIDGKLILAADRPDEEKKKQQKQIEDTLLVGRVVATYGKSLKDNPVLTSTDEATEEATPATGNVEEASTNDNKEERDVDAHLSVPKGSVKVGRFFYPKKHPSFFEQPMFQPVRRGAFTLKQVLGTLNARVKEETEYVEKYKRSDFYNKTFLLTSHPIGYRKPKGKKRWSLKHNKFVEDPPSKEAAKAAEEEKKRSVPIRVMQVLFHANNTFSTVAGLGEAILRGKFDIIGHGRDQLWMQVWRFGFGRSVSGSVYSEGRSLTHEDAKTYWGTISPETGGDQHPEGDAPEANEKASSKVDPPKTDDEASDRLEVKGSVLFGSGLEPMPVARFIMRETQSVDALLDEDDDEDEEEADDDIAGPRLNLDRLSDNASPLTDGIDWSGDEESSFQ